MNWTPSSPWKALCIYMKSTNLRQREEQIQAKKIKYGLAWFLRWWMSKNPSGDRGSKRRCEVRISCQWWGHLLDQKPLEFRRLDGFPGRSTPPCWQPLVCEVKGDGRAWRVDGNRAWERSIVARTMGHFSSLRRINMVVLAFICRYYDRCIISTPLNLICTRIDYYNISLIDDDIKRSVTW